MRLKDKIHIHHYTQAEYTSETIVGPFETKTKTEKRDKIFCHICGDIRKL